MVRQWYSRCSKTGEAKALSLKTTGCVGEVSSAAWLRHDEEARPKMWLKPWARIRERSLTINNNNDDDVGDNRPLLVNNLCMPVTMFSTLHIQTWFFFPVLVSNCCYHVPYFRSEEIEGYLSWITCLIATKVVTLRDFGGLKSLQSYYQGKILSWTVRWSSFVRKPFVFLLSQHEPQAHRLMFLSYVSILPEALYRFVDWHSFPPSSKLQPILIHMFLISDSL